MKRLIPLVVLLLLIIAFVAFPVQTSAKIFSSPTTTQALSQSIRDVEKTDVSLADCPVWAQLLVAGVVGLFGWLAIVPMFVTRDDRRG